MPAARRLAWTDLDKITPAVRNPKRHDLDAIRASLTRFGIIDLVVVDERTGRLVGGHGRVESLQALRAAGDPPPDGVRTRAGTWQVQVIRGWTSTDDDDAEAALVALNRATELGGWDDTILADLLGPLRDRPDLLAAAGYTLGAVDELLAGVATKAKRAARENRDPDLVTPTIPTRPRTRHGDIWHLGPHRLICGDATDPATLTRLADGTPIDLVFTSPPYNVGVDYTSHDDATVPWPNYRALLDRVVAAFLPHLPAGRAVCWNVGTSPRTYHHRQIAMLEDNGLTYLRTLIWQKVGVPVPLWHNTTRRPRARKFTPNYTHEIVAIFTRDQLAAGNPDPNLALAVYPARRPLDPTDDHDLVVVMSTADKLATGRPVHFTDTLEHDVFTVHQSQATADLPTTTGTRTGAQSGLKTRAAKGHPAPFPVGLPEAFIVHLADLAGAVLDPFAGSASTLLAAHYTGRIGLGVELDPGYCDVAAARWQHLTDVTPRLERAGKSTTVDLSELIPDDDPEAPTG